LFSDRKAYQEKKLRGFVGFENLQQLQEEMNKETLEFVKSQL